MCTYTVVVHNNNNAVFAGTKMYRTAHVYAEYMPSKLIPVILHYPTSSLLYAYKCFTQNCCSNYCVQC